MASGFMQRFKGKITVAPGGLYQGGAPSQATYLNSGAPTSGSSGTYAGIAPQYAEMIDTSTGTRYINTGTQTTPTWTANGGPLGGSSVNTNLTATGSTSTGALALTARDNVVATVAAGTGVMLGSLAAGQSQRIWNRSGTLALKVYAPGGRTIDGTAGTSGVSMTAPDAAEFFAQTSTAIVSTLLGTTVS